MLIPFLLLFFTLAIATAIIAVWSDNLGKKLGKKRVSVWGLRPRDTARVLTVGSSLLIMAITLGALLAAVTPLRNALFYYESDRKLALEQIEDAKREAKATRSAAHEEVQAAHKEVQLVRDEAKKLRGQVSDARGELKRSQTQIQTVQRDAQTATREAQTAKRAFQNARQGETNAKRGAQTALVIARNAQGAATTARLGAATAKLQERTALQALKATQTQLGQSQLRLTQEQNKLARANDAVKSAFRQVAQSYPQVAKAKAQVAQAQAQVAKSNAEVASAQADVNTLQAQRDNLKKQVAFLNAQSASDFKFTLNFASGNIRVPVDQTLAERRFDISSSTQDIERQLRILIDTSQESVQKLIPNSKVLARTVGTDPATGKIVDLDENQTVQLYAQFLVKAHQPVSARLVSAFNYPADSPEILGRFVFVPIRTIYIARENIAEATIDASKSESAIFGDLQRLVDDARRNAVKRDASPPLSPDEQNFFDGDTGQKLLDALHQVQKVGHPVEVRIVAARDLDAAEPLQIRFEIGNQTT